MNLDILFYIFNSLLVREFNILIFKFVFILNILVINILLFKVGVVEGRGTLYFRGRQSIHIFIGSWPYEK